MIEKLQKKQSLNPGASDKASFSDNKIHRQVVNVPVKCGSGRL